MYDLRNAIYKKCPFSVAIFSRTPQKRATKK